MANSAKKPASTDTSEPKRWWQWLLLYPAFAVSLITASPQWVDKAKAFYYDVQNESFEDAMRENSLWRKNLSCATAPYAWYTSPKEVKVDATICKSGDVFVRASSPSGHQVIKWLAVDEMLKVVAPVGSGIEAQAAVPLGFGLESSPGLSAPQSDPALKTSQFQSVAVICQRFIDQRRLLRHVRAENGMCFDEIIDTFNGSLMQRNQVQCRPSC